MKKIDVACAIITIEDKTLVVQRSENMKLPLKWEFPGGKIEEGETAEACIIREIKEELSIEIQLVSKLSSSNYDYTDCSIQLIPFIAIYLRGDIRLTEHKQYILLNREDLHKLDWAEADVPILKEYIEL